MKKREYQVGIELTDRQWKKLESFFPKPPRSVKGGQIPAPNRACLEGVLWLLRSGARYKDIPKHFPSGSTCWRRLKWLYEQGALLYAWQSILGLLDKKGRLKWEEFFADGTFASAKKGAKPSVKPSEARERR